MGYVLLGLLGIAVLLFLLSFFQKDEVQLLREELDQFSLQQLQENYQLKKKIKVLEEELLFSDDAMVPFSPIHHKKSAVHEIIKNQVLSLWQQGSSIEQISKQSSLPASDVQSILSEHGLWGDGNK